MKTNPTPYNPLSTASEVEVSMKFLQDQTNELVNDVNVLMGRLSPVTRPNNCDQGTAEEMPPKAPAAPLTQEIQNCLGKVELIRAKIAHVIESLAI
jgi:hypothetical protein